MFLRFHFPNDMRKSLLVGNLQLFPTTALLRCQICSFALTKQDFQLSKPIALSLPFRSCACSNLFHVEQTSLYLSNPNHPLIRITIVTVMSCITTPQYQEISYPLIPYHLQCPTYTTPMPLAKIPLIAVI